MRHRREAGQAEHGLVLTGSPCVRDVRRGKASRHHATARSTDEQAKHGTHPAFIGSPAVWLDAPFEG